MRKVKIYDKGYTELTTLIEGYDIIGLNWSNHIEQEGGASFNIEVRNSKATTDNLKSFNRVEIIEGGTTKWWGFILRQDIDIHTVTVRCVELLSLLKYRTTGADTQFSGDAGQQVKTLLSNTNTNEDTGISFGSEDVNTSIDMTFNRRTVLSAMRQIADRTDSQLKVDLNRNLVFKDSIGEDKTSSIELVYDVDSIENANIDNFDVQKIGSDIVTKAYGESGSLSSSQSDSSLNSDFGLIEDFRNFRVANTQSDLDGLTSGLIQGQSRSPRITLTDTASTDFEVGDTVQVTINNKLVNIDSGFQVKEKNVTIENESKKVEVRVDNLFKNVADRIADIKERLNLVENNT